MFIRIMEQTTENISSNSERKCVLFGSFSYIVQLILGVLSFMVLVLKRFREKPRRPWKVWFFDVSKQIISASTIHMMNLFLAIFLSINTETKRTTDECMWYFINLFVDTSLGAFICFSLMLLVDKIAKKHKIKSLQSGMYYEKSEKNGKPVIKLKIKMYLAQLGIWIIIVIVSKFGLLGFTKLFEQYLESIGNFILKPFLVNEKLELIMVMIVFPIIFNAIQFWILDNILKLPPEEIKEIENVPEVIEDAQDNMKDVPTDTPKINLSINNNDYVPPIIHQEIHILDKTVEVNTPTLNSETITDESIEKDNIIN